MKSKLELKYNPNLSIRENAKRCGVTEADVRWFIKTHLIDRNYEAKMVKFLAVQKARNKNPQASYKDIANELGYSVNTVKKYYSPENKPSKTDSEKLSKFDMNKPALVIKTVSNSQEEILCNILQLYVNGETFDCDLTTSRGVFYQGIIPFPKHLYDKYPQLTDVKPLEDAFALPSESFHSVIVDLPFLIKSERASKTSRIAQRFSSFRTVKDLYEANDSMITLAFRLLRKGGYLIMKTMDYKNGTSQLWIGNYVHNKAEEIGFKLVDLFILISKTRMLHVKGHIQHSARKYHSYFFVFKKP